VGRSYGTGTSARARAGEATVRRWKNVAGTTFLGLVRQEGAAMVWLACDRPLAQRLLAKYGFMNDPMAPPGFISVSPLIGLRVRYTETATGLLTTLEPLDN
jgi:hypothetical protein